MADRRMIHVDILKSERFARCDWPARTAFLVTFPLTDRDGFMPRSGRELAGKGLGGLFESWAAIEAVRDELFGVGLWRPGVTPDGRKCIWVNRFRDYQKGMRYNREPVSSYLGAVPEDGGPPFDVRDDAAEPPIWDQDGGKGAAAKPPQRRQDGGSEAATVAANARQQVEVQHKRNTVEAVVHGPAGSDDDHRPQRLRGDDRPGDPNQLIRVWRRIFQEVNEKMTAAGRPIIPKPVLDVHRADRLAGVVDALQYFPDDDTLAAELRRVLAVFEFFGWKAVRAEAVIEKVGQSFEDAPGDIRDPVVWQKDDPDANPGRMAPAVREIAAGIGKEMPDGS